MNSPKNPREVLETVLGLLAVECQVEEEESLQGITLQIRGGGREFLIGSDGKVLDDLQLVVNRILQASGYRGPRVQLDVEQWRENRDQAFLERIWQLAEGVRANGRSVVLDSMNSYERRLVHQLFEGDTTVTTWSPPGDSRMKRVTIRRVNAT
jgi:predicted RNA-binding protein Jag